MSAVASAVDQFTTADTLPASPEQPMRCGCGRSYDEAEWHRLPAPKGGVLQDDGDGGWIALRNCTGCGSTLGHETWLPMGSQ